MQKLLAKGMTPLVTVDGMVLKAQMKKDTLLGNQDMFTSLTKCGRLLDSAINSQNMKQLELITPDMQEDYHALE